MLLYRLAKSRSGIYGPAEPYSSFINDDECNQTKDDDVSFASAFFFFFFFDDASFGSAEFPQCIAPRIPQCNSM